jgi:hypothetical protein
MPSAQECAERLREQAYRTLLPQIRDLEQELQNFNLSLLNGVRQLGQKLEILSHMELPATEAVLSEILDEMVRRKETETNALALFASAVRGKETQEEILGLLLDSARVYFPHVALFAVRGDRIIGWSSRGFSDSQAKDISSCSFPRSELGPFREAIESDGFVVSSDLPDSGPLNFLKGSSCGRWHILSLRAMQRPAAVLLCESEDDSKSRQDSLSVLAGLAALRLENIALKILYELSAEKSEAPPPQPAPTKAVSASAAAVFPEPASPPGLQESMRSFLEAQPAPIAAEPEAETVETELQPPAEAASEPVPDEKPAAPMEAAEMQPPAASPLEAIKGQVAEEEKLHTEAKRFARLLVSEIKLYNEHHVLEGRENRDLYLRLKRDIDRSREMYEKRVSTQVSRRIDYFHDEIIRILGDNDPSTLGSDYPGPRVES